jgi:hypothetical protein
MVPQGWCFFGNGKFLQCGAKLFSKTQRDDFLRVFSSFIEINLVFFTEKTNIPGKKIYSLNSGPQLLLDPLRDDCQ